MTLLHMNYVMQDMLSVLLKGELQWRFLIPQRPVKQKSVFHFPMHHPAWCIFEFVLLPHFLLHLYGFHVSGLDDQGNNWWDTSNVA